MEEVREMKGVPAPQPRYSQVRGMTDALVGYFVLEPSKFINVKLKGYR